jgi:tetratricopeptide (TPR) repeat protein
LQLPPGHQDRGLVHLNLANAAWALGDVEEARIHYEHALRVWEDISEEHPWLSYALTGLGRVRLAADDAPGAVELLDRAIELRDHEQEDAMNLAETSLLLARALWATQRNPQRALELATQARDLAKAVEPANVADLERLLSGVQTFGLSERLVPAGLGLFDRRHPPR